jgi:ABC-type polar amino acid transport system ATPase subunit
MTSGTRVRIDGVGKRYGGVAALAGLDLELRPGITGLLGPNGAGKTTLIRILATLLAPSAGEVRVNGWRAGSPGDRVEIRRRLGYLPQDLGLYPRFTDFEFVDYLAILKELDDPADRHRRVWAALEAVELEDLAGRKIRTLSGGMRRRVGIAQAIVADPQLLLLLPMCAAALLAVLVASCWSPAVGAAAGMGAWALVLVGWRVSQQPVTWLTGPGAQAAYAILAVALLALLIRRMAQEGWALSGGSEAV